jgi:hypothetical protein
VSLKDSVKKATNAAGIAAATAGLSTCQNSCGTVVDPAPPPLICSDVAMGQSLVPSATRDGDNVAVSIRVSGFISRWQITRVGDPVGATIATTTLPTTTADPLLISLRPATPTTTQIDFTVEGALTGDRNQRCDIKRTFHVSIGATGVQIAETNLDSLPLSARHGAQIAVTGRAGRTLALEARTMYRGPFRVAWDVTGGEVDAPASRQVSWVLPDVPGIYQAEVLLDYGADGIAFDTFLIEVKMGSES